MTCPNPSCAKEMPLESFFCVWCGSYAPVPGMGEKPNLFARFLALVIDPAIGWVLYLLAIGMFGIIAAELGLMMAILFPLAYAVWFVTLLRQGLTPGKKMMGLQVVQQSTGRIPGFGKMFLREVIGRILSGLFLGVGYLWALVDKNGQAFHDKLAGTVVVKLTPDRVAAPAPVRTVSGD
jgi:uncharacterized RDD family membrane protein YckC